MREERKRVEDREMGRRVEERVEEKGKVEGNHGKGKGKLRRKGSTGVAGKVQESL